MTRPGYGHWTPAPWDLGWANKAFQGRRRQSGNKDTHLAQAVERPSPPTRRTQGIRTVTTVCLAHELCARGAEVGLVCGQGISGIGLAVSRRATCSEEWGDGAEGRSTGREMDLCGRSCIVWAGPLAVAMANDGGTAKTDARWATGSRQAAGSRGEGVDDARRRRTGKKRNEWFLSTYR